LAPVLKLRNYFTMLLFMLIGVNSDETVDVAYVDYGNSETLPFSEIRKLPDFLLGLPRQVMRHDLSLSTRS
jgi:hypothetical protein